MAQREGPTLKPPPQRRCLRLYGGGVDKGGIKVTGTVAVEAKTERHLVHDAALNGPGDDLKGFINDGACRWMKKLNLGAIALNMYVGAGW